MEENYSNIQFKKIFQKQTKKELESKDWKGTLYPQNVDWSLPRHIWEYLLHVTDNKEMFWLTGKRLWYVSVV